MPGNNHMKIYILSVTFLLISNVSAIDIAQLAPQDMDKAIYTLNYIRVENKEAAEKLEKLYLESEDALERSSISKLIDILLQSCIYLAERIKNFEENFNSNPASLNDLAEEFELLKEL